MTKTEDKIKELVGIEEVLCLLDQYAGTGPETRASLVYLTCYAKLIALRDEELRGWNEAASSGLHDRRRMLYRCDQASHPYHTDANGPCEVWGTDKVCSLHVEMEAEVA